jgi:hypothetical protein
LVLLQSCDYFAVVIFPLFAFGGNHQRLKPQVPGNFESHGVGPIGDDNRYPRVRNLPSSDIPGDGFKIRTAARQEDAEIVHAGILIHHGDTEAQSEYG